MTTALKKNQPEKPDLPSLMDDEIIRLEVATETMMAYIGYLNTKIMAEEEQPKPNRAKITALQEQMDTVSKERKAITPSNEKLIARAIYVYAPIMKALDA